MSTGLYQGLVVELNNYDTLNDHRDDLLTQKLVEWLVPCELQGIQAGVGCKARVCCTPCRCFKISILSEVVAVAHQASSEKQGEVQQHIVPSLSSLRAHLNFISTSSHLVYCPERTPPLGGEKKQSNTACLALQLSPHLICINSRAACGADHNGLTTTGARDHCFSPNDMCRNQDSASSTPREPLVTPRHVRHTAHVSSLVVPSHAKQYCSCSFGPGMRCYSTLPYNWRLFGMSFP